MFIVFFQHRFSIDYRILQHSKKTGFVDGFSKFNYMADRILVCSKAQEPLFFYNVMRNGEGRALDGENQIKLPAPDFNQKVKVSWPAGVVEKYNDLVVGACENDCSVYSTCGLFPTATIKIKLGLALTILSSFQVDTLLRLIISATALNKTAL